jgi:cell division protein FtsB
MAEQFPPHTDGNHSVNVTVTQQATTPESEKNLGKSMLMKAALATLLIAALVISISNVMRANQLRAQAEEMQAEYDKLKEENRKLQYFLNKEVDEDYIIEYARDVLGMYFPDEDVYYNDVND